MKTIKQIKIDEYGSNKVLKLIESKISAPKPGHVQIQVSAIGVNYSDILRRRNVYFMPTPLPYVLGSEAVGIITETGDNLEDSPFQPGTKVLAILPSGGGYSEFINADAQYCVPLPPSIEDTSATALFVQGSTAHLMISDIAGDLDGKTILVHAASGGVGSLLVQLGKLHGAKVIAAGSSNKKLELAKKLGADVLVNYSEDDWKEDLIQKNEDEKVDFIFEMVGGEIFNQCFGALKQGGSVITFGAASGDQGEIESEKLVDENHQIRSFNLAFYIQNKFELWQKSLGTMIELLASDQIKVENSCTYNLQDAAKAHHDLETRVTTGKVVLVP